jgi:hypothetical protein
LRVNSALIRLRESARARKIRVAQIRLVESRASHSWRRDGSRRCICIRISCVIALRAHARSPHRSTVCARRRPGDVRHRCRQRCRRCGGRDERCIWTCVAERRRPSAGGPETLLMARPCGSGLPGAQSLRAIHEHRGVRRFHFMIQALPIGEVLVVRRCRAGLADRAVGRGALGSARAAGAIGGCGAALDGCARAAGEMPMKTFRGAVEAVRTTTRTASMPASAGAFTGTRAASFRQPMTRAGSRVVRLAQPFRPPKKSCGLFA